MLSEKTRQLSAARRKGSDSICGTANATRRAARAISATTPSLVRRRVFTRSCAALCCPPFPSRISRALEVHLHQLPGTTQHYRL
jgi:hypothetical protein